MTQLLIKTIADFSTTLVSKLAVGATTGTLTSGLDGDGVQLPTGTYGFTIDRNNAQKEHFTATLTGSALTDIKTVTRGTGVGTAGLLRTHRKGAEVVITDHVALKRMMNVLDGTTSLDASTPIGYDGTATISTNNQLATKAYADGLAIAGSPDSSTSVKGIGRVSVAPVSAGTPIFVGDNDGRVPTQSENDALIGTSTPSTTNPFVNIEQIRGIISPYSGSAAPTGWLLCDGSAVSRTTYADLFAIMSTSFGIGDGTTTFNLPDMRSRMAIGKGTGTKVATFSSRSGNVITVTGLSNASNNEFQTGQAVLYDTTSGVITGLTDNTTYYIVRITNTTFSLATTLANAQNGTVIALSSDGSGTQIFTQTLTARTLGDSGGEETHAMSSTEILSHSHVMSDTSGGTTGGGTAPSGGGGSTSTQSFGGNSSMNIMNPFVVLNYIVKY